MDDNTGVGGQGGGAGTSGPGWVPPPPPPPAGSAGPLTRSVDDRIIAGVAGGVGAHFHIDPWIVRIAFIALSFVGGIGVVIYVAAWVLLPEAGSPLRRGWDSVLHLRRNHGRALAGSVLIVAAVLVAAGSFHFEHEGLLWGIALVGVGVFLLVQDRWQPASGAHGGQAFAAPAPAPAYAAGSFGTAAPAFAATTVAPAGAPAWRAPQPRQRSVLGLLTVAAALLAVGVAALLDSAGVVSVSVGAGAAVALIVVGAGLVAGSWFGRSRLLIALGVVLIPVTVAATLVREPLAGGTGNVAVAPQALADVQREYHLAAGRLSVDLTGVFFDGADRTVTATLAFGQMTVSVPEGVNVDVRAHAGFGELDLLGAVDDGVSIGSTASRPATGGTASPPAGAARPGTLHLHLSVGFGRVNVILGTAAAVPAQVP